MEAVLLFLFLPFTFTENPITAGARASLAKIMAKANMAKGWPKIQKSWSKHWARVLRLF